MVGAAVIKVALLANFSGVIAAMTYWEIGLAFGLSLLGARAALEYSRRGGPVDIPNDRSLHVAPIPRGGGVGIVVAALVAGAFLALRHSPEIQIELALVALAVALVAAIGWLDDRATAPIAARLTIHVTAGLAVGLLVYRLAPVAGWLGAGWLMGWLFWTVASINIVNFMDGIDGMVTGQGVVFGAYVAALCGFASFAGNAALILVAACAGFLIWNWAPAKIFMGDVGSGALGLLFVTSGALALRHARAELIFLPLLPLYLDALMTMVARRRRRERLTQAHRSHLYQRMAKEKWGHARVTTGYALAAAVGALLGLSLRGATPLGTALAISGYVIVVFSAWRFLDAMYSAPTPRRPEAHNPGR